MDDEEPEVIELDLTDEVNANWRDRLRANPNDPAFRAPPGAGGEYKLTPVEGKQERYRVTQVAEGTAAGPDRDKVLRLAEAIRPIYDKHRQEIDDLKHGASHWTAPDFIWEAILASFSTMGNAKGYEQLIANSDLNDPIRFENLRKLHSDEEPLSVLEDRLTAAPVRWPRQKASRLLENFQRIEKAGGPEKLKWELISHEGQKDKITFLRTFKGIGPKYARNMMMDVYHEDFRNSIAIDSRLKKVLTALGFEFEVARYEEAEQLLLDAAHQAGLNGWEMDRLIFSHLKEVLESLAALNAG